MSQKKGIDVFDQDVVNGGGYVYTTSDRLSSRLATQRTIDIILETDCFKDRTVLDMGCGDGHFTIHFWDVGSPRCLTAVDAAAQAIKIADKNKQDRPIEFMVGNAHHLPYPDNSFDVVLIQSILHHDDDPQDMIREAFRLAPLILIHEPNGNNLGLKIIEKISPYHREHGEKSYNTFQFRKWIRMTDGSIIHHRFAGFVPMFCPDWLARLTKTIEPVLESIPLLRDLMCSVVVIVAKRGNVS
jgi:ubiquinone/menaquinone biosynthesis C-methylase UbiE